MDCYSRVVRKIIAEASDLPIIDVDFKEKETYRELVWPDNKQK